jgi:hypothetical protein
MASKVRVFDNAISLRSSFIDRRVIFLSTGRRAVRINDHNQAGFAAVSEPQMQQASETGVRV